MDRNIQDGGGTGQIMNALEQIYYETPHRICQKWAHYFRIYERFFARYRGRPGFRMLEIGISQGGSLDMWRAYFGPDATIVGVDIDPRCVCYEAGNTLVRIGSQEDRAFLQSLVAEFGSFDVILDDGGHTMTQQITTFEVLYPTVPAAGVYMVEDCHTSYHAQFGGALGGKDTFMEHAKRMIDELNGFHVHSNPELVTPSRGRPRAFRFLTVSSYLKKIQSSRRGWCRPAREARCRGRSSGRSRRPRSRPADSSRRSRLGSVSRRTLARILCAMGGCAATLPELRAALYPRRMVADARRPAR